MNKEKLEVRRQVRQQHSRQEEIRSEHGMGLKKKCNSKNSESVEILETGN